MARNFLHTLQKEKETKKEAKEETRDADSE
jgi:hypothetical protein